MKTCSKCTKSKSEKQFYFKNKARGTRQAYCISCFAARHKKYYQTNKSYYQDKKKRYLAELVEKINRLKSQPCTDCGQKYPPYVMDFDHLDSSTKVMNIARLVRTGQIEKTLIEIEKCEVVCANCHRERTHGGCRPTARTRDCGS
jgi:hypothetical protein